MSELSTLIGLIDKILVPMMKYSVPRYGKVESTSDPEKKGKVLVTIPSFNWTKKSEGIWAFPADKKSMVIPEVGTYVIIKWIDGNSSWPYYEGVPTFLKDQIPESYDGTPGNKILFEQDTNNVIKYLQGVLSVEIENKIELGKDASKAVAREGDDTLSNSTTDSTYWSFWTGLISVFQAWTPVPNDGGAALKVLLTAFFLANPTPTSQTGKVNEGSSIVKAVD